MWVIKTQGETYYVNHVYCSVPWSTKETPENSHTKGSIKVKRCLVTIDDENTATIVPLTLQDIARIKKSNTVRLITAHISALYKTLKDLPLKHGPIKEIHGGCGSEFAIVELAHKDQLSMLLLAWPGNAGTLRVLMPNEKYYDRYDDAGDYILDIDDEDLYED